jgi:ribA/ribD-fused uncharacterized protein
MESLVTAGVRVDLTELVKIATTNKQSEFEIKVLSGLLQTKDDADRIVKAIEQISLAGHTDEHRATFGYSDNLRVVVTGAESIYKVCSTNSFQDVPLVVERKQPYFQGQGRRDVLEIPDLKLRFTLRKEEEVRRDFSGSPSDDAGHVRILHRKSWMTPDGLLRIDLSQVKSKNKSAKTIPAILRQTPTYELEIEVVKRDADPKAIVDAMLSSAETLLAAYQQSSFVLTEAEIQNYLLELEGRKIRFINPVTLARGHLVASRAESIHKGYTVTNKADGERCMLVVARDRRLLRWSRKGTVAWTGLTARDDSHHGDTLDGEYLADRNLFCIFDIYSYRKKETMSLPLMLVGPGSEGNPLASRLGCAREFVNDVSKSFDVRVSHSPFRIETKLFLSGDGIAMEKAINTILDTKFEYATDGLIFTPRSSPVAPSGERRGDTWVNLYKWKPPHQNSIDFLLRFKPDESYDSKTRRKVYRGTLYVSRFPDKDIIYPCETLTGEYIPPKLPYDMVQGTATRVPSPFQPSMPHDPLASEILLPINARNVPMDSEGQRIEDNTIVECTRDILTNRWTVMRTRHDKTYQYRVLRKPEFGNSVLTAQNIWTNIHSPITEHMIRHVSTEPLDDTFEDTAYYRDSLAARDRSMGDVIKFHNSIKEKLYSTYLLQNDTLLELAVGRANDIHKWRKSKPSLVVGVDLSPSNLDAPVQGACVRYIQAKRDHPKEYMPPALFIPADMTRPLLEQDHRYLRILAKQETAPTPYLEKFAGLTEFTAVACQFAIHYACESEETFRTFVGNLDRHCKSVFFGTCMDGQAVYSMLMGNGGYMFRSNTTVWGHIEKQYADGEGWTEEFGRKIQVKLESFERPVVEYLVPFGKVREILAEAGFELLSGDMFGDLYSAQKSVRLEQDHHKFSALHRMFAFKRGEKPKKPEPEPAVEPADEERKADEEGPGAVDAAASASAAPEEKKPKQKKLSKKKEAAEPGQEPVLFAQSDKAPPEFKALSTEHDAKIQIDGITFATVEHYVQWSKAKMFGDAGAQTKIMKTASAKSVKTLGNKIQNVKEEEWEAKRDEIMRIALRAKFTQHPDLRALLLSTGDRPIGEADARDKYWSIGTGPDTAKAKDPAKWPGKNMLGKLLMELRTELRE